MNYHERELFKIMRNDFRPVPLSVSLPSLSLSSFSLFRDEQPPAGFISDLDNDHFSVDARCEW
jgi:hypothetical protein